MVLESCRKKTKLLTHSPGRSQGAHIPVKHPAPLLLLQTHPRSQQEEEEEAVPRLINDSRLVKDPRVGSRGLFCAVAQAEPSVSCLLGILQAPCTRPHKKCCDTARSSGLEAQFPFLPALRMKSELLLLCLCVLCLGDTAGHSIRDPTCPRFHTEICSEP